MTCTQRVSLRSQLHQVGRRDMEGMPSLYKQNITDGKLDALAFEAKPCVSDRLQSVVPSVSSRLFSRRT